MKKLQLAAAALGLTLAGAVWATAARADALAAQLTKVTFSDLAIFPAWYFSPAPTSSDSSMP